MEEFFKENYSTLTKAVEIMAVVTGLLCYKKYSKSTAKFFIFFLCYIIICEIIATYTHHIENDGVFKFLKGTILERNYWFSTIYWKIGAIVFFSYYYNKIIQNRNYRLILKYSTVAFLVVSLVQIVLEWDAFFVRSFPIISVLGALIILQCSIFYFIEVLSSENILTFYRSINFFISAAILIWWLIITPLVFFDLYFTSADWDFVILKWQIYLFANFFMYSTFTIGLIVSKPELSND